MFNPQSYAVRIEHILTNHCLASLNDAGEIRNRPFEYLDKALRKYEMQSEEKGEKAADLWDKYENEIRLNLSLDELGKEKTEMLVNDIRALF